MLNLKKELTKIAESLATIRALTFSPISNRNVTNADDAPDGIIYCSKGVLNTLEDYLIVIATTSVGYKLQLAFQMSGVPTKIYLRKRGNASSSTWTS